MSNSRYDIGQAVADHKLYQLEPLAPGAQTKRALLLMTPMQQALSGPWAGKAERMRLGVILRQDLERYVTGRLLRLSLEGRELADEEMKRLTDAREIWEYKSPEKPGIRVFGRFARKDVFIATHWQWRRQLGAYGSRAWQHEMKMCERAWNQVLPTVSVHEGRTIHDYASDARQASDFY